MHLSELDYTYPESLVATQPQSPSRVLWVSSNGLICEISLADLLEKFFPGDVLVLNDSRVLKRRIFSIENMEILFIKEIEDLMWEVLFPSSRVKQNQLELPAGVKLKLLKGGRPQLVQVSQKLGPDYFEKFGEMPLPPYIQKQRDERHQRPQDEKWYQPQWAKVPGSLAAPTASLHLTQEHLKILEKKGVQLVYVTLHVGLGTFLPIDTDPIEKHLMHSEECEISFQNWHKIVQAKRQNKNIWALGTTSLRAIESVAQGLLTKGNQSFYGSTNLFIYPGFQFQIANRLMTNFHQPKTTLLALVAAFAGNDLWRKAYAWAIEKKFRLFSYGDLTIWEKYIPI